MNALFGAVLASWPIIPLLIVVVVVAEFAKRSIDKIIKREADEK